MICAPRREPLELECASPEVAKPLSASPWKSGVCLRRLKLPSPRRRAPGNLECACVA